MKNDLVLRFEDDVLLVVDKPAGIPSIPERYEASLPSVLETLKRDYPSIQAVHRLDKDTSGLLLFSKTEEAYRSLAGQFESRSVRKTYHALVAGRPAGDEFVCDAPLLPDGDRRHRTIAARDGKPSVTRFRLLRAFRTCSLVEANPETGRTHQIRVHLACLGLPILCDPLYGSEAPFLLSGFKRGYRPGAGKELPLLSRLALHAAALAFDHLRDGRRVELEAPYPKDFSTALKQLEKYG